MMYGGALQGQATSRTGAMMLAIRWEERDYAQILGQQLGSRLTLQFHPGYYGKLGMRHYHLLRNHYIRPTMNVDKVSYSTPKFALQT
jgi:hypothetical protein